MASEAGAGPAEAAESRRLDRWLWYARFCKTRALATRLCQAGKVRVNRMRVRKPHYSVCVGDVLTFAQGRDIRVVRVLALGERRGPATEARALYEDLRPDAGAPGAVPVRLESLQAARRPAGRPARPRRRGP